MVSRFRHVIELWPRRSDFARDVGVSPITASAWWQRDSIPAAAFNAVVAAAKQAGHAEITVQLLADLAETRRRAA